VAWLQSTHISCTLLAYIYIYIYSAMRYRMQPMPNCVDIVKLPPAPAALSCSAKRERHRGWRSPVVDDVVFKRSNSRSQGHWVQKWTCDKYQRCCVQSDGRRLASELQHNNNIYLP